MRNTIRDVTCALLTLPLIGASLRYIRDFWLLSFIYSFQVHIAIACLVASICVFFLWRSRWAILLAVWSALLLGHGLYMEREFSAAGNLAENSPTFRLLSFNILNQNRANGARIATMAAESGADAVMFMEARPIISSLPELAKTFPWRVGCGEVTRGCDLVILSRHPVKNGKMYRLSDLRGERFATAVVEWKGREINLAAIHLTKPYFDNYHDNELRTASYILGDIQGPLILGGDFNSSGIAPDMQRFIRLNGLNSANRREPATWPVRAGYFGIPIDHIYTRSPGFITSLSRIEDNFGSNHFGLIAEIAVPE